MVKIECRTRTRQAMQQRAGSLDIQNQSQFCLSLPSHNTFNIYMWLVLVSYSMNHHKPHDIVTRSSLVVTLFAQCVCLLPVALSSSPL